LEKYPDDIEVIAEMDYGDMDIKEEYVYVRNVDGKLCIISY
jgi:hypothetical protein